MVQRLVRSPRNHCPEGHSAPWHLDYRTFWCRSLQNRPISFQMDIANPICRPQYKVSPEAAERLRNPIEGVLRAIVIKPTISAPFCPESRTSGYVASPSLWQRAGMSIFILILRIMLYIRIWVLEFTLRVLQLMANDWSMRTWLGLWLTQYKILSR